MRNSDTLIFVVIFPGSEHLFNDFIFSVEKQSDQNFDLLILNDSVDLKFKHFFKNSIWINAEKNWSFAKNRMIAINFGITNDYKYLIICDIDDLYTANRIELSKKNLQNNNFIYNELTLVNETGNIIENDFLSKLKSPIKVEDFNQISEFNFIGMSNSAINLSEIDLLEIPDNIIAVDWYIYTVLLLKKNKGKFVDDTTTFYRQHENNIVGVKKLTEKRLLQNLFIKSIHYQEIANFCFNNKLLNELTFYKEKLQQLKKLEVQLEDLNFKNYYIEKINKNWNKIFKGWWSEILTLEQLEYNV